MQDDIAIDLRGLDLSNIKQVREKIYSFESYKFSESNNLKFLIVTWEQRYLILQYADRHEMDAVTECYLGLQIAVAK